MYHGGFKSHVALRARPARKSTMAKIKAGPPTSLPAIVNGAVGPFDEYCMGYMNPGASGYGYISTLKLSTGIVKVTNLDPGTEGIVSYDRCEKNDAYIGQI